MRKARSLRVRVLLLAALSITTALTVAGVTLAVIFNRHLEKRLEQELETRLMEIAASFSLDGTGAPRMTATPSDPQYQYPYSGAYWQVSDAAGKAVLRSRSLWDDEMPASPAADRTGTKAVERAGPDGSVLFVLERTVQVPVEGGSRAFRLSVALDYADIDDLRRSFAIDVGIALAVLGLLLLVGAWLQAGIGLRPLQKLRDRLNAVHSGRAERLHGPFPDEVEPLASDVNALLDRQQELVTKARERAGDLAHGLKTPLTILSSEARRIEEAGLPQRAAVMREQIGQMRRHVERELARARTQGTATTTGLQAEIGSTTERLLRLMQRMPRGDEIAWTMQVPAGTRCEMDPDDFGEVLGNLLDNARKFAKGSVTIRVADTGGLTVSVDDDGPGLTEGQAEGVLARGVRGREDVEGSGLGLSIVNDVLGAYGSRLQLGPSPEGGLSASFTVAGAIGGSQPDPTPASAPVQRIPERQGP